MSRGDHYTPPGLPNLPTCLPHLQGMPCICSTEVPSCHSLTLMMTTSTREQSAAAEQSRCLKVWSNLETTFALHLIRHAE